jgi:CubicO group peptidase (beta-lactamase class C family)
MRLPRITPAVLVLLTLTVNLILGISASSCTAAPVAGDPELRATLEREVPRLLREGDIPGISIAVIRDGKIAWSGAYGVADPASGAPVRPETVFQAASLTKPVFAYMVLRLADRGVIDLDQPLWAIIPEPRLEGDSRARQITARHVLSHTTGLPNQGGATMATGFAPGERFGYSGEGFNWLQKAVEKLTGTSAAELVRREVLAPLGMTRSSLIWEESFAGSAAANVNELGTIEPLPRSREANAAASLLTTAEDYARFLLAIVEGKGLAPGTREAMLTPRVQVQKDVSWGLGWGLQAPAERTSFWHWGHMNASRAFTAVRRDGSAGLVYFANSHEGLNVARALAALAMDGAQPGLDWLQYESFDDPRRLARRQILEALRAGPDAGARRWREQQAARPAVVDDELTLAIAGSLIDQIRGADATAILQAAVAEKPGSAALQDRLGTAHLVANDLEAARRSFQKARALDPATPSREAELRWIEEALDASKHPVTLSEDELRRFTGDYGSCHATIQNGRLVYTCDGLPPWVLVPLSSDTFAPEGVGNYQLRFSPDLTKLTVLGPQGVAWETPRN